MYFEVENNIDNRIRYFENLFGSQEKMEEFYGKSVPPLIDLADGMDLPEID